MIDARLSGDGEVLARLAAIGARMPQRVEARIEALAARLQDAVVAKLSNDVLQLRSGRLAASIAVKTTGGGDAPAAALAVVGPAAAYAAVQEYGGTVTVRAHLRTIREAWGRPIAKGAETIAVRAHAASYPERSFLRAALADLQGEIRTGIGAAVAETIGGAS